MTRKKRCPEPTLWEKLNPLAQEMRLQPTPAERALWQKLRGGRLEGYKFRRQHVIDRFIVDFYCPEARLAVELDGPIHQERAEQDRERDETLSAFHVSTLRFTNEQVLAQIDQVLGEIARVLNSRGMP